MTQLAERLLPSKLDWRRTYIVGSGGSAKGIEFARLRGRGVLLGVNEVPFYTACDAFFSLDRAWVSSIKHKFRRLKCEVHLAESKKFFNYPSLPGAYEWLRVLGPPSFSPNTLSSGIKGAGCSGLTAINLAAQLGARRITLFGFDLVEGRYDFWFRDGAVQERYAIAETIENFRQHAKVYQDMGIEIDNASPGSAIDAFPIVSHSVAYV